MLLCFCWDQEPADTGVAANTNELGKNHQQSPFAAPDNGDSSAAPRCQGVLAPSIINPVLHPCVITVTALHTR